MESSLDQPRHLQAACPMVPELNLLPPDVKLLVACQVVPNLALLATPGYHFPDHHWVHTSNTCGLDQHWLSPPGGASWFEVLGSRYQLLRHGVVGQHFTRWPVSDRYPPGDQLVFVGGLIHPHRVGIFPRSGWELYPLLYSPINQ